MGRAHVSCLFHAPAIDHGECPTLADGDLRPRLSGSAGLTPPPYPAATETKQVSPPQSSSPFASPPHIFSNMISPLKDIVIGVTLGIGAGMVYQSYVDDQMNKISRFYKWYDAQKPKKTAALHDDDE